jgi:hypothetical protein
VRAITPQVLYIDVGCVWFGAEAVVSDINTCVGYGQAVNVERVEAVGVFGERGDVGGYGVM